MPHTWPGPGQPLSQLVAPICTVVCARSCSFPTSKLDPWGMHCESRVPLNRVGQSDVWVYMPFPMMVNEILISQAGVSTRKLGVELADEYHAYRYELAKGTNVITSV